MATITNNGDDFIDFTLGTEPGKQITGQLDKRMHPELANKIATGAPGLDAMLSTPSPGIMLTVPQPQSIPMANATEVGAGPKPAAARTAAAPTAPMSGQSKVTLENTQNTSKEMGQQGVRALNAMEKSSTKAAEAKADVEKTADEIELEKADKRYRKIQELDAQRQIDAVFEAGEFDQHMQDVDKAFKDLSAARVDDKNYWGKLGTGNQVMAAIGLALGAVGQAVTGQDSQALKILNMAVDRDIDAQKANIAKLGKQTEVAQGRLKDFMGITKDRRAAEALAKASALEVIENEVTALMKTMPEQKRTATITGLLAGIQKSKADALAQASRNETVTTKQEQLAKPKDAIAEGATEKLAAKSTKLQRLYEVKNFFEKQGTGPLEGRLRNLGMALGKDDPNFAAAQTALQQQYQRYKLMITGTASSEKQDKELQKLYPNINDTDANFMAKLEEVIKEEELAYDTELNAFEAQNKNHGMQRLDQLRGSTPSSWQQYVKPMGK